MRASVRATEITRGAHGWHPHLHVLLQTDGFTDEEKETLLARWLVCVERELGPACVPSAEHALRWSPPIDWCTANDKARVRYLVKLGLELSGPKAGRRGSMSQWDVARAAVSGDEQAVAWWREFYRATKGRRMVELDDRAADYARRPMLHVLGVNQAEPLAPGVEETVMIPVDSIELRALRQYEARDPAILAVITADVAKADEPRAVVRAWLDHVMHALRYTPGNVRPSKEAHAQGGASSYAQSRDGPEARAG